MTYTPTLKDLEMYSTPQESTGGYTPSIEDISQYQQPSLLNKDVLNTLTRGRDVLTGMGKLKNRLINMPYDLGRSIQGFGKNLIQQSPYGEQLQQRLEQLHKQGLPQQIMQNPLEAIHFKEPDYGKLFGQTKEPEGISNLIQKGIEYAPELMMGGGLVKGALKGLGKLGVGEKATSLGKSFKKPSLEQEVKSLSEYEKKLYEQFGMKKPESFGKEIFTKKEKIKELEPLASEKIEPVENLLAAPTGETELGAAQKNLKTATKEIEEYLMPREQHDVMVQEYLKERPQELRNLATRKFYDPFRKKIEDVNIQIPSNEITKSMHKELGEFLGKDYELNEGNKKIIDAYLSQNKVSQSIPLSEMFDTYRATKDELIRAKGKSFQQNIPEAERMRAKQKVKDLEPVVKKQNEFLEKSAPEEALELKKEGDKFYAENIRKLYNTPLYWEAQKGTGLSSTDLMKALRGQGKYGSQKHLREFLKDNPIVGRALVGQKYAEKPMKLAGELKHHEEEFIDNLPQLKGMRERLRESIKQHSIAEKRNEILKKESENITRDWEKIKNKELRNQKARIEIKKHTDEIKKLEKEYKELEKRKSNIEELKKVERKMRQKKQLVKYLAASFASLAGIKGLKSIWDLLN